MRELGEYLKQMREAQSLSLSEIAESIKVSEKYLEALEDGNHEALPPEIYVRGFIKAYGQFLGADIEDLYARYEESKPKKSRLSIFQRKPPKKKVFQSNRKITQSTGESQPFDSETSHKPIQAGVDAGGIKSKHLIFSLIGIVIVVVILAVVRSINDKDPTPSMASNIARDNLTTINGDVTIESPLDIETLTQEVILPMGDIAPSWAISQADSLILTVRVRQRAWLRVEMDYRTDVKGYINPNQDETYRAKNSFYLSLRDPDLFLIRINGFDLVSGEKLREIAGVAPQSQFLEIDINRSNVVRYLEGYKEIVMPSFVPPGGHRVVDTTAIDTASPPPPAPAPQPRPATQQQRPAQQRPTQPQPTDEERPALMPMGGGR